MTMTTGTQLTPPVSDRDHIRGNEDAPVTLVEFADYQCPYCGDAYRILREIEREMGDALRIVFRNFPLTEAHSYALQAAEAAEAAASQGKFWPMHDLLFEHQKALDGPSLLRYADSLGLDIDRFRQEIDQGRFRGKIESDVRSGEESGVPGTPTFFINGRQYEGSWDRDSLLAVLQHVAGVRSVPFTPCALVER